MRIHLLIILSISILLGTGCSEDKITTYKDYSKWLSNPENGCKVSKRINDMVVSVKYLPPAFLALKDYDLSNQKSNYDSLYKYYLNSVTFVMSFDTKKGQAGDDVMYKDLNSFKEYVERSLTLNFDLESRVVLKTNTFQCSPVLSSLENTYGLSKGRDVYLVFSSKDVHYNLLTEKNWDFIYNDDIYNVGILHYMFDFEHIQKTLPKIEFKNS